MSGSIVRKSALTLMMMSALSGCLGSDVGTGAAIDRLRPDAEAHARSLAGDDMQEARKTGLVLIARLGALANWK